MIGKTVSHYKILEKIGEGGMGTVYKAEDTKLKRTVALKFLPPELTRDPEAKERFIREAQTASALDHPNICTIYEIDEMPDGQLFMVMACYEGMTLKDKIKDEGLRIKDAVDIASQIGEGLAKAHEKGIVHRDMKPANIFITNEGVVKILDFGLAKLTGQAQVTKDASTLGTVAYMSPEQLSGKEVDQRTDIWSLGMILYEMLSGELPFKGDYEQAIVYAVLNEKPKPLLTTKFEKTELSQELERIVTKTLMKEPDKRYPSAEKMLEHLNSLRKPSSVSTHTNGSLKSNPRFLWYGLAAIVSLVLIMLGYWLTRPIAERVFRIGHTMPLTTAPGLEQDPSWSPEGTRIAYASDESGNMDIWVKQITAGQKINLTRNHAGYDGKPVWSPDGEWIAYISERHGGGIFILPALGGIPKQIISRSFARSQSRTGSMINMAWSPDGSELVYAIAGSLYTISSAGVNPSALPLPPRGLIVGYSEPSWSPNGERIACTGYLAEGISTSQIWSLHRMEDDPFPVTDKIYMNNSPVWAPDGKSIFFISDRGGSSDVWWFPVDKRGNPTSPAKPLTAGVGVSSIALSKDGRKLAYSKVFDRSNIWSVPIVADRLLTLKEAQPLIAENHYIETLSISPDGQWIAFDSNRRGNMDIWIMRKDGSDLRQLTTHPAHDWTPRWSPDGKKILFHSLRSGNRDLFVMPVGGGGLTQITSHPAEDLTCDWSPDGLLIGFDSNRTGNMDLWVISSDGKNPRQLTFDEGRDFLLDWAPDGKQIVFSSNRTGSYELYLIPEKNSLHPDEKGNITQLTQGSWVMINSCYWTRDGQTIYAYGLGSQVNQGINFWNISLADGSVRPVLDLSGSVKEPLNSLTSDGERLYFPLWERIGDLWIAELEASIKK